MSFMGNIDKFIDAPGKHASNPDYKAMKETLVYMKKNALGAKNIVSTDKIVSHLNSNGYKISREYWQINILGYLRDNGIFIVSKIPKGMFLINSEKDAQEAYTSMQNRVTSETKRLILFEDMAKESGYNIIYKITI
jgi:hypothetical protein